MGKKEEIEAKIMRLWEETGHKAEWVKPLPGSYIIYALHKKLMNGDAFVWKDELYPLCRKCNSGLSPATFQRHLAELISAGKISLDGRRVYLTKILRYENAAAHYLARILKNNTCYSGYSLQDLALPDGTPLSEEQHDALALAVAYRLSIILGGAGCGKTSLISCLAKMVQREACPNDSAAIVLCAPTGKAARNLSQRTGLKTYTVHSALGKHPDEDFLDPVVWAQVELVVVDEASMLTLEMLAGILCRVSHSCHIVLLGDPNQLLSVGTGNVIPDLLTLGIPSIQLKENHRQSEAAGALQENVVHFSELKTRNGLKFDSSFHMSVLADSQIKQVLVEEAAHRYLDGESIQVLSPCNRSGPLSVSKLNDAIRNLVNPASPAKKELSTKSMVFRSGDRVMITQNDRDRDCSNGDVGTLLIVNNTEEDMNYSVLLPDGRHPVWCCSNGLEDMTLAYAMTVHKAQGSEVNSILMPLSFDLQTMMNRNLFYTAISRARAEVHLFGNYNTLEIAMQRRPRKRKSMLITKTRMVMLKTVS